MRSTSAGEKRAGVVIPDATGRYAIRSSATISNICGNFGTGSGRLCLKASLVAHGLSDYVLGSVSAVELEELAFGETSGVGKPFGLSASAIGLRFATIYCVERGGGSKE